MPLIVTSVLLCTCHNTQSVQKALTYSAELTLTGATTVEVHAAAIGSPEAFPQDSLLQLFSLAMACCALCADAVATTS